MKSTTLIFAVATAASAAFAQDALVIQSPPSLVQCQPTLVSWSGGTQPYYVAILPGGQASATALESFPEQTGDSYTWTVDLAAGQEVTFRVTDSTGAINYSSQVMIYAGSSTTSPRLRRPSGASLRASSAAGPILVPQSAPDQVTRLISEQYAYVPSSAALQETDLSVQPLGLDLPDEPPDAFRRQTLLSLDLLRGLLLVLLADENIQLFLRADRESDENWYSKQDKWTESPLYALRLLANPAAPGFMLLGGIGIVLFQQSRLQLGWSQWRLLRHFAYRGATLMLVNSLLSFDFTLREDGPTLVENLLLFSFGINHVLLGSTVVALHAFERYVASRHLSASAYQDPFQEQEDVDKSAHAETVAHYAGNGLLLLVAAAFFAMNMLAVPSPGTRYEAKSDWYWFWIMPNPLNLNMIKPEYHRFISQYPPLNWLPFGLLGIFYGRFLTRHPRTQLALHSLNLVLFFSLTLFFILTRVLQFGNLSSHLLPSHPHHPKNPYLETWQAFFYTVKFPPDLAYSSLSLGLNALLFTLIASIKTEWKEALFFLQFGRAPVFFYAANLFVFRFVANFALTSFGLPSRLDLAPAIGCYVGTLVITWFLCRGFVAFKDARSSPDSLWRFF
ncbi:MAG: hypothetical protein CYPHOPRED_004069 [Cyphobasidiales sp. Tagirdzhanova-0007]|nr:MAG: hypothetical protein CYPHOPRED_004069 [Cyphobasidiales sp. Tagirdzhanova-0007]